MSEEKKDGGPAFPNDYVGNKFRGISKREWFAGMALQGLLSNPTLKQKTEGDSATFIAEAAFALADAMLKQGEKK